MNTTFQLLTSMMRHVWPKEFDWADFRVSSNMNEMKKSSFSKTK